MKWNKLTSHVYFITGVCIQITQEQKGLSHGRNHGFKLICDPSEVQFELLMEPMDEITACEKAWRDGGLAPASPSLVRWLGLALCWMQHAEGAASA